MEPHPALRASIAAIADDLKALSRFLHAHPETGYLEHEACRRQVDLLRRWGFAVESPYGGLATAFRATAGEGHPVFAVLAEYDALPEIGHACGHNLICTAALGAGKAIADRLRDEQLPGTVVVLGTPGEEGCGGKIDLLRAGAFADIDAAIMAHPDSRTATWKGSLGIRRFDAVYHGLASHAAVTPEKGRNALDAVMLLFAGINAWRQHLPEDTRVHGIVTEGGVAPNIVPDRASCRFYLRANDLETTDAMERRFLAIAEGAALMTDTTLELVRPETTRDYLPGNPNDTLNRAFFEAAQALGMDPRIPERGGRGSTDFSDVSQVIPATHIYYGITDRNAPLHSLAFAEAAATDEALAQTLTAAAALADVGHRFFRDREFRDAMNNEFNAWRSRARAAAGTSGCPPSEG
jgi:amidohydrolase